MEFYYWNQRRGTLGKVTRNDLHKWHLQYVLFVDFVISKLVAEYAERAVGMEPDIHVFKCWSSYNATFPSSGELVDAQMTRMPHKNGKGAISRGKTVTPAVLFNGAPWYRDLVMLLRNLRDNKLNSSLHSLISHTPKGCRLETLIDKSQALATRIAGVRSKLPASQPSGPSDEVSTAAGAHGEDVQVVGTGVFQAPAQQHICWMYQTPCSVKWSRCDCTMEKPAGTSMRAGGGIAGAG